MEEWLQEVQDFINNIYYSIQYAKVFALAVLICFIIVFIALAIQGHRIKKLNRTIDAFVGNYNKDSDYMIKMIEKQLKISNSKGGNGNGNNNDDEHGHESDHGRS